MLTGKQTSTWGFNGAFLGPTLRAGRGDKVEMAPRNRLPEVSTVHWHGMRLPAQMDGPAPAHPASHRLDAALDQRPVRRHLVVPAPPARHDAPARPPRRPPTAPSTATR
ncbi:multicopper oxidase domain-containing protein [Nonomuraea ceibae]|uniref:multicopper oxidase domain-containing protein n=1 Tax=Nonomuraea ceibae TaxID=1935170 RepID=UPI0035590EA2